MGNIYVGNWVKGRKNGFGILTTSYRSNDGFIGDSSTNIYTATSHENPQYSFKIWGKYYGNWSNDKLSGFGIYVCYDGTLYVGNWKNSRRKGQGFLLMPNGDKIEGEKKKN